MIILPSSRRLPGRAPGDIEKECSQPVWLTDWVKEFFRKADMVLLALIVAASLFGVVLIYSATRYLGQAGIRYVPIQIISILLGVVAYFIMSFVDVELFTEKSWKWMFGFNVFIILLLKTPFGVGGETTGNNSWLAFPFLPVNIQPAEVAKVFFVLLLALQCRKLQDWGAGLSGALHYHGLDRRSEKALVRPGTGRLRRRIGPGLVPHPHLYPESLHRGH